MKKRMLWIIGFIVVILTALDIWFHVWFFSPPKPRPLERAAARLEMGMNKTKADNIFAGFARDEETLTNSTMPDMTIYFQTNVIPRTRTGYISKDFFQNLDIAAYILTPTM